MGIMPARSTNNSTINLPNGIWALQIEYLLLICAVSFSKLNTNLFIKFVVEISLLSIKVFG